MTKDELRKKIADKILDWAMSGELTKMLDGEAIPTDTISITIDVKGVDRGDIRSDVRTEESDLVIGVKMFVDGKDGSQHLGHGPAPKDSYDFVEVSATP